MQRFFFVVCCLVLSVGIGRAAAPTNNEPTLYGAVIESSTPPQDGNTRGDILDDPKKIRILNLGKVINHTGLDYGPTISADGKTLFFVSNRKGGRITRDGDFSHDFWAAKKLNNLDTVFFSPYNIDTVDAGVNSVFNEGVATIAADRQTLYFTGCNRPDGLGDCDIYVSEVQGDRWGKPVNLGPNVNSEYWDSQPTISPDKTRLYFVSNRPSPTNPDGEGETDTDIWFSEYDDDMNEWKKAKNLGPDVNTAKREASPFIGADGNTLFFASDGHLPNIGGLDFYRTKRSGEKDREGRDRFAKPMQLPAPINTKEDEQFISLPASGDVLYFSSRRKDLPGFQGDLDIFMAFIPSYFRAVNLIVNVIDECTGQAIPATVTFKNTKTGRSVKDSVNTATHIETNTIVTNDDYGTGATKEPMVQFAITAFSPAYGERSINVDVEDPGETTDANALNGGEIRKTIMLGQRPVIGSEMAFSAWSKQKNNAFRGLVMEEKATIILYPLLNYIFFDLNSADFPSRYTLFKNASQTANFNDEKIPGGTFDKYYTVLNIYGYRLKKYPNVKLDLVGCLDETNEDKNSDLSKRRAEVVFNYLKNIWGIDESRMKITSRGWPALKSNIRDTFGVVENRRTEIIFNGDPEEVWQCMRPILDNDPTLTPDPDKMNFTMKNGIDNEIVASRRIEVMRNGQLWKTIKEVGTVDPTKEWDWASEIGDYPKTEVPYECTLIVTSKNGTECRSDVHKIPVKQISTKEVATTRGEQKTLEKYNLILFPFDKFEAGPFNERILQEYVFPRVKTNSEINIEGHTDVVGMYDHNKKLSENRAGTVKKGVDAKTSGKYLSLESIGTGEDQELYTNNLPEGRFFNRTVQVRIETPLDLSGQP